VDGEEGGEVSERQNFDPSKASKGAEASKGNHVQVASTGQPQRKQLRVESPLSPEIEKLVYDLIGIGMRVHTAFGPGLRERVYEDAFVIGLEDADMSYQRQVPFNVKYLGRSVSPIRIDLVVEEKVIVELKAVTQLHDIHSSQLMTYLKLTGLPVGVILNFNMRHLKEGIRRHIRSRDPS
jgi:GxxExxY protein